MVASSITVDAVYLDGRQKAILVNAVRSLEDGTDVKDGTDNGLVEVNERWDHVKRSWNLSYSTDSSFVENLFEVQRQSHGFLFVSPLEDDGYAEGESVGTGDGSTTEFQLTITKSTLHLDLSVARSVTRKIEYPLPNSVVMYVDGIEKAPVTDYTYSTTTGVVTFVVAPAAGKPVTADFSYAWPVRFTSKILNTTLLEVDHKECRSVQIEEIF